MTPGDTEDEGPPTGTIGWDRLKELLDASRTGEGLDEPGDTVRPPPPAKTYRPPPSEARHVRMSSLPPLTLEDMGEGCGGPLPASLPEISEDDISEDA